jgi:hypothetical protein
MNVYQPRHFTVQELVSRSVFSSIGASALLRVDRGLLVAMDTIRDAAGVPIAVNNWADGGERESCCLRLADSEVGSPTSFHRIGHAADLHLKGYSGDQARALVLKLRREGNPGIMAVTAMERGVSWLHIDTRPSDISSIILFDP